MAVTYWLADKSALTRILQSLDGAQWQERIERGLVRVATATRLEIRLLGALTMLHVDKDFEHCRRHGAAGRTAQVARGSVSTP